MQNITVGMPVAIGGVNFKVTSLRPQHDQIICESDAGAMAFFKRDEFLKKIVDSEISLLRSSPAGKLEIVPSSWQATERDGAKAERLKREAILSLEQQLIQDGHSYQSAREKLALHCMEKGWSVPSERTLRNWRKLKTGHTASLAPRWARCGNRHQGPDEILLDAMREVVESTIQINDRFSITQAWRLVDARYQQLCEDRHIKPMRHSSRKLSRFVKSMGWSQLMHARLDGRTASAITRTAVKLHQADKLWDQVEMDASTLDVFVCDADGNEIGRPVLYAAIDVCSGYPLGLHVTIQKASTQPFVACLEYMLFPKPEGFDQRYNIQNRIEAFGKPEVLKVDNGSEFIGEQATAFVEHLGGNIARCRPYKPEEKPIVERFFGVIRDYVRTLPGSTLSVLHKDARETTHKEQLLTVEELTARLYRFIYDDYCLRPNESRSWRQRKAVAPLDIWRSMSDWMIGTVPVDRVQFEMAMYYSRASRKLSHSGIHFETLDYHSEELAQLYAEFGPHECEFLYSELDASTILVIAPDQSGTIKAHAKQIEGLVIDRKTLKELGKSIREQGQELTKRSIAHRLAELEEHKKSAKSSRARNRSARRDDMMEQAMKVAQASKPRSSGTEGLTGTPAASATTTNTSGWGDITSGTSGRKRGA